jgi:hypothetical protein
MGRRVLAGLVLVVLGGVAGVVLADRTLDPENTTVTVTRTVSEEDVGLPRAVEQRRDDILRAAEGGDHDRLARIAASNFTYTFGAPLAGGPAAYWRQAEQRGEKPLEALAAILKLPYTLSRGIYVWPFAYDKSPAEITRYEESLLRAIPARAPTLAPQGYLGWRVGIRPDGRWIFFVAGD